MQLLSSDYDTTYKRTDDNILNLTPKQQLYYYYYSTTKYSPC